MADIGVLRGQSINFEVFRGNNRYLGIAECTLPTVTGKTVDISGAGVAGEIAMPTLAFPESFQLELQWRTIYKELYELSVQQAVDLILYNAQQLYNHGSGKIYPGQVKINVRGIPKETDNGKIAPASTTDSKNTIELIYYKVAIQGEVACEIDKINYKYIVNGIDYLSEVRNVLNI